MSNGYNSLAESIRGKALEYLKENEDRLVSYKELNELFKDTDINKRTISTSLQKVIEQPNKYGVVRVSRGRYALRDNLDTIVPDEEIELTMIEEIENELNVCFKKIRNIYATKIDNYITDEFDLENLDKVANLFLLEVQMRKILR